MPVVSSGEQFPDLEFETYHGKRGTIEEVVKKKKHTVIWVMRFIGCRFCQYDIDQLKGEYGRFRDRDTQVFVVLQSSRDSINGLKGELDTPFDVICDTKHLFYKELDIRTTATKEDRMPKDPAGRAKLEKKQKAVAERKYERQTGEGEAQQLPALFILDQNRKIEYAHYAVNSVDIPDFDEILEMIETF